MALAAAMVPFADTVRLTRGARFVAERHAARVRLLALELALVTAWAVGEVGLRWRPHLAPRAWEGPLALGGCALAVFGGALAAWAKIRLGRWFSGTFGVQSGHRLITDGPYAVTRHPIYSGLVAVVLGQALMWNRLTLLVLAAALAATFHRHTVHEEALFEQHFGDEFRRYRRRVPRLVPGTGSREDR